MRSECGERTSWFDTAFAGAGVDRLCRWHPLSIPLVLACLTAAPGPAQGADWTVLVYLDADNDLHSDGLVDLGEMQQVGSTNAVNVVVQWDGWRLANDTMEGTRRYLIQRGQRQLIDDLGELNMGDPQTLESFVRWGMGAYPANRYALVLWNHGDGWRSRAKTRASSPGPREPRFKALCVDDTSGGDRLYMAEVSSALQAVKTTKGMLDVIGFDACLMGMVEVALEISPFAEVMVGSQQTEPANGWPYNTLLQDLTLTPTMTPRDLGRAIVDRYGQFYATQQSCTQSAVDLTSLGSLLSAIDAHASAMIAGWNSLLPSTRFRTQSYFDPAHVDLHDFAGLSGASIASYAATAQALQGAIDSAVIHEWHTPDLQGSHGLAVYFPATQPSGWPGAYNSSAIQFAGQSTWDEFLSLYLEPAPTAPTLSPLADTMINTAYTVGWSPATDSDGILGYNLQETTRHETMLADDAEGGLGNWSTYGFTSTSGDYHSFTNSFYSGSGNNLDSQMRTAGGLPIPADSQVSLSFWARYDTEESYDYGYAEISADGTNWVTVAVFNGAQPAWQQYQYDLADFTGSSLWVRFRYVTDFSVSRQGVYVDDIMVTAYEPFRTLSANLQTVSYSHRGKSSAGRYHYRVRARDFPGKWGPWSDAASLNVSRPPVQRVEVSPATAQVQVDQAATYRARAYDSDGDPIPGVVFSWTALKGGTIDSAGLFTAGAKTGLYDGAIRATADGKSATASVRVTAGPLETLSVSLDKSEVVAGGTARCTALGYDKYANAVDNVNAQWSVINGGGTIQVDAADASQATFTAQTTPVGDFANTVQARAEGVGGTATVKVVPDVVSTVNVTPDPGSVNLGETLQFGAEASDQYGNSIANATWEWGLTAGGTIGATGLVQAGATAGQFDQAVSAKATTDGVSATGRATLIINAWYAYRPGKQILTVPTTLPGLDAAALFGTNRLAQWDAASDRFALYAQGAFDVAAGQGYVANLPNATDVQVPGGPPASPFIIDLGPGRWHLIGNPYGAPLPWEVDAISFQENGGPWRPLRDLIGAAARSVEFYVWKLSPLDASPHVVCGEGILPSGESRLGAGEGAWIRTDGTTAVRLSIPRPARAEPSRRTTWVANDDNWALELVAQTAAARDDGNYLGLTSRFGPEGLHLPGPPAVAGDRFVDLALSAANTRGARSLALSLCSSATARAAWEAEVTTNVGGGLVTLSWPDLTEVPSKWHLRLIDLSTRRSVSMRTTNAYSFRGDDAAPTRRQFRLELSPSQESRLRLSAITVAGGRARGPVRVSFALSEPADVRWQLRSATGRRAGVAGAMRGEAGLNAMTIDLGRATQSALPAGVYLLELIAADEERQTVRAIRALTLK